ncbi:MAG TPA: ribosomal L7Ae/L30e/S12e/Gadd45 family protein [Longimicrobiaceae bacterium]|nr:ribosomal L7Ae/L30e/S12e/Gadd45 family protein [Longimicrobiaceae bacterium]
MAVSPRQGAPEPARRRALQLLGLAARAGGLVGGTEAVRRAARGDGVFRVILAEDAAPGQRNKLLPLLEARRVPSHTQFSRGELGAAIGRGPVSAVGFTNRNFAGRAAELFSALQAGRFTAEP